MKEKAKLRQSYHICDEQGEIKIPGMTHSKNKNGLHANHCRWQHHQENKKKNVLEYSKVGHCYSVVNMIKKRLNIHCKNLVSQPRSFNFILYLR